ncbi:1-acyl-sn-glycerol-3-phosphate acyltransferase [Nocardioides baekrokdamisoli]|uniref:1-acyl-sn-glycerol-3-phosphate acyltransferase n=1 Tax=Nocardioides baekrokdamisoli TaxID=1804624 RepID=A0A3G9III9_9ACTN|nr:lysophospholipid acyltransferase family protein [Nocardioides baekrokdamisoli]BBH18176.1 1-acyl-sn-glycerol-3-phosphate acyltransferase [Nocardioides baekrokdamisoli]
MGKFRKLNRRPNWAWSFAVAILLVPLRTLTKRDWRNADRIPADGGAIIAINHVSHVDPLTAAHLTYEWGRQSHYLAKAALFRGRLGTFLRAAGQIPVDRSSGGADALSEAIAAVNAGELVVVYIEGSITKDPTGWPMVPKTGAARLALATGAPVIPVGQWGAQEILPAYSNKPKLFPRKTVHINVGEPMNLAGIADDAEGVHRATDLIMGEIVALVEDLRGEKAPAERFDPIAHGMRATGNPNKD